MPDSSFRIVRAALADASEMLAMQSRAFDEEARLSGTRDIPPLQEDLASIERDIAANMALIARDDGRTVGSARGEMSGTSCEIRVVCVEPGYQGRGIGAALVRAVEQAHPDAAEFRLTTNTVVPGNVEFYERLGYRVANREPYGDSIVVAHLVKTTGLAEPE